MNAVQEFVKSSNVRGSNRDGVNLAMGTSITTDLELQKCQPESCWFTSFDGTRLHYRHWRALSNGGPRGAILLLHRGHEHGGRMSHLVEEGVFEGFDVFAWDARGHGKSDGARGYAPDVATLVRDLDGFSRHITDKSGVDLSDCVLVGQSVGAVIAASWVHDYAPEIRAMILAAPAFRVNLFVPFARQGLAAWKAFTGDFTVKSYVRPSMLSQDAERIASYTADHLVTRDISANLLLDLFRTADRVVRDAPAINVPTQILVPEADYVVDRAPQQAFYEGLGSAKKELHTFRGLRHDVLGERDRQPVIDTMSRFIQGCFDQLPLCPNHRNDDVKGFTRDEFDRLSDPVKSPSLSGVRWGLTRGALRAGRHLSQGLRIGYETGFDSGSMLDYVYENKATGVGPVGRLIDRTYLDSPGWEGIRQRGLNLQMLIKFGQDRLRADGQPVHIADIAAGHGRYICRAVSGTCDIPDSVALFDQCRNNVARGRALLKQCKLDGIARFETGDAFDGNALAQIEPRPTLAIVSGLYELFPENSMILRSLEGLSKAVPTGGYIIYTGQPWHPQIELIARTLPNHRDGSPWVMRRRTQAELDWLVSSAGFQKVEQRIDPQGIFTVSIAQRMKD